MAAGYDRDCEAFQGLDKIGFGFVEVGTILPEEPFTTTTENDAKIFLLNEDKSIINRNDASKGEICEITLCTIMFII
jgi:dihydroorotate dehydrogenase